MQNSSYISHHGILGQKWGKKNGPPYPLGVGDHSASEKKAGWRDSLKRKGAEVKERHKQRKIRRKVSDIVEMERSQGLHMNNKARNLRDIEKRAYEGNWPEHYLKYQRSNYGAYANDSPDDRWWDADQRYKEDIRRYVSKKYGHIDLDAVSSKTIDRGRAETKRLLEEADTMFREAEEYAKKNDERLNMNDKRMTYHLGADDSTTNRYKVKETIHYIDASGNGSGKQNMKNMLLDRAKSNNQYDINFLEKVQNTPWLDSGDTKTLLKEYGEYLDDPEKYWGKKLPQV